jgi:hypothetical protein
LSPQKRLLVDDAARTAALLKHVDAYLFGRDSVVDARRRALIPATKERLALADHLRGVLKDLGLDRVPARVPTLESIRAEASAHGRA